MNIEEEEFEVPEGYWEAWAAIIRKILQCSEPASEQMIVANIIDSGLIQSSSDLPFTDANSVINIEENAKPKTFDGLYRELADVVASHAVKEIVLRIDSLTAADTSRFFANKPRKSKRINRKQRERGF